MASEQGVERFDATFEFLAPAFDAVSDAVAADDMYDAESGEDGAVGSPRLSPRSVALARRGCRVLRGTPAW